MFPRHVQDCFVKSGKHHSFTDCESKQVSIGYLFVPKEPLKKRFGQRLPVRGNWLVVVAGLFCEIQQNGCGLFRADVPQPRIQHIAKKTGFCEWRYRPLKAWRTEPFRDASMVNVGDIKDRDQNVHVEQISDILQGTSFTQPRPQTLP